MGTVTAMCLLPIVMVTSGLSVMMDGEVMNLTQSAGKVIASDLLLPLLFSSDNWATPMDQPKLGHITEMSPRILPWTKLSVPPAIITSRTVPTIPLMTVVQVKELELSALRSLNIL